MKLRMELSAAAEANRKLNERLAELEGRNRKEVELSATEQKRLIDSTPFQNFLNASSRIALRAIQQNVDFDIAVDYTQDSAAVRFGIASSCVFPCLLTSLRRHGPVLPRHRVRWPKWRRTKPF
jgi:hypothetical protein